MVTWSSQICWPRSPLSTANEGTFLLCLTLSVSFSPRSAAYIYLQFISVLRQRCIEIPIYLIPFSFTPLPLFRYHLHPPLLHQSTHSFNTNTQHRPPSESIYSWQFPCMAKLLIGGVEINRRLINWIFRNMQMNCIQFKCRFWHFSAVRRRMSERKRERESGAPTQNN